MTNKNIFDAIRNVDEKFILSAAPSEKAANRPGKILLKAIFSATAVILVVALSIGGFMMVGKDKTPDVDENKPKEDIFLSSIGESAGAETLSGFGLASEYGLGYTNSETKVFDELKNKETTAFAGSKTFVYEDSKCSFKNSENNEYGTFYCVFDEYAEKGVKAGERIKYLHGTNNLVSYFSPTTYSDLEFSSQINEETAKKIAEEFILKIISEKDLSKYDTCEITRDAYGIFQIVYRQHINGYDVDDSITINVSNAKRVTSYYAANLKKYENLESKLTKEKLDAAHKKLIDKIEEMDLTNLNISNPLIVTNTTGEVFIRIAVDYDTTEGGRTGSYMYVNVK